METTEMVWKIDAAHSQLGFAVRHMMISTVRGKFAKFDADVQIDPASLSQARVTARIDAASIDTGDEKRDGHLRSADFLDVEKHPTIEFESTQVSQQDETLTVRGLLKIRGEAHPITLQGEVVGPGKDPWGNTKLGFSLSGDIDREQWGLTWNQALEAGGVLVAKKVKLELELQLVQS
jgi:polyisoprenoid-binding protein YceI